MGTAVSVGIGGVCVGGKTAVADGRKVGEGRVGVDGRGTAVAAIVGTSISLDDTRIQPVSNKITAMKRTFLPMHHFLNWQQINTNLREIGFYFLSAYFLIRCCCRLNDTTETAKLGAGSRFHCAPVGGAGIMLEIGVTAAAQHPLAGR